jgi:hypothetical protein
MPSIGGFSAGTAFIDIKGNYPLEGDYPLEGRRGLSDSP